jgi:hypothetical protein
LLVDDGKISFSTGDSLLAPHSLSLSLSLSQFDKLLATHHGIIDGRPINKSGKLVLRKSVRTLLNVKIIF